MFFLPGQSGIYPQHAAEIIGDRFPTTFAIPPGDEPFLERQLFQPGIRPARARHELFDGIEAKLFHGPEMPADGLLIHLIARDQHRAKRHRREGAKLPLPRRIVDRIEAVVVESVFDRGNNGSNAVLVHGGFFYTVTEREWRRKEINKAVEFSNGGKARRNCGRGRALSSG